MGSNYMNHNTFDVPFIFLQDQLQLKYWYEFSNTSLHSNIGELQQNTPKAGVNRHRLQHHGISYI